MKPFYLLLSSILTLFTLQGCNTLYSTSVIDIEIVEPGKVKIPSEYRTVAVRYNNINVSPHPHYAKAYFNKEVINEDVNYDSIASEVYYDYFVDELQNQDFFDTVIELKANDYNKINVIDTITHNFDTELDSIIKNEQLCEKLNVYLFSKVINEYPNNQKEAATKQYLHPRLAMYNAENIRKIADSTQADLLISLDYFSSFDGIQHNSKTSFANEVVLTQSYWNFYDLNKQAYSFFYNKKDTINWTAYTSYKQGTKKLLPPRKDAILNAADIAGSKFAQFLVPHWIQVQRMYYNSGHIELKNTKQLIEDGKWLEAAKIWKANVNNPNKSIAAKSKFNMGLVCEIQGNLDAALEWVVESFYVLGQKNQEHYFNCTNYIRILSQRKHDIRIIESQLGLAEQ